MRRLDFVDSRRGLAALYIVVFHMTLVPDPHFPHWAQAVVLNRGTTVTALCRKRIFSVPHMMAHACPPGAVRDFYIRRLFRIAPRFYATLVFTTVRDVLYFRAWHSAGEWAEKRPVRLHVTPAMRHWHSDGDDGDAGHAVIAVSACGLWWFCGSAGLDRVQPDTENGAQPGVLRRDVPFGVLRSSGWRYAGRLTPARQALHKSLRVLQPEPTCSTFSLRLCNY